MTTTALNANVFKVEPDTSDSDYDWALTSQPVRHYTVNRINRKTNLFEVKLIGEAVVVPLPPGEGADPGNDQFVDTWNDNF